MKYQSPTYGKVDWPWWHDLLICGGVLLIVWLVAGPIPPGVLALCAIIFILGEKGHWGR